ncbi:isochorismatase family protein [Thioclava sp. BHET1]|nr:isochorismatase family protein [Thioclava sp. BHET1]
MVKALVIIDMQMDMQHRITAGVDCVNPEAGARIARLATAFRQAGSPVLHVRHQEEDPTDPFHADAPGYPPMPCAEAAAGEAVFVKRTRSAFASTKMEDYLREAGITELIVAGAEAAYCIDSTVREGADLGFAMTVVRDAVLGFDQPDTGRSAQRLFDDTMGPLAADFARMTETAAMLSA